MTAQSRAHALLRRVLDDSEWREFEVTGMIQVPNPIKGIGRIEIHASGQVIVYPGAEYGRTVCVVPALSLPRFDIVVALYLLAKYNPRHLLTVGNWHGQGAAGFTENLEVGFEWVDAAALGVIVLGVASIVFAILKIFHH
jgi:hypothetical protein